MRPKRCIAPAEIIQLISFIVKLDSSIQKNTLTALQF